MTQAELDKAKELEAKRKQEEDWCAQNRNRCEEIARRIEVCRSIVLSVHALVRRSREAAQNWSSSLLDLICQASRIPSMEEICRSCFVELCRAQARPIRGFSWEIGNTLAFLQVQKDGHVEALDVLTCIEKSMEFDSVSGEAMALLIPLLRRAILDEESQRPEVLSSALSIIGHHCSHSHWTAAMELARAEAGAWLLRIISREDALFGRASDILVALSATCISPGPQIKQLLTGLTMKSSVVRETTLEVRLANLAIQSGNWCPKKLTVPC